MSEHTFDLTGRKAACYKGCAVVPSSTSLPFFDYLGEGSRRATEDCGKCGMSVSVHQEISPSTGRPGVTTHGFVPCGGAEFDSYYCGCHGWD